MIKFTLPNFFSNYIINRTFHNLATTNPEYFVYKNLKIVGQEGHYPYFYWSGNNYNDIALSTWPTLGDFQIVLSESCNLPLIFNCANPLLLSQDFYDNKNNEFIKFFNNGSNKIIISNPIFGEYLKNTYPYYTLIGDNNYKLADPDKTFIDNLTLIRCNYKDIDSDFYKNISKNKIDIDVTDFCSKCSEDKQSDCQLLKSQEIIMFMHNSCIRNCQLGEFSTLQPDKIIALNAQGYSNFHLNLSSIQLTDYSQMLEIYINLFIKDEYKDTVRLILEKGGYSNGTN